MVYRRRKNIPCIIIYDTGLRKAGKFLQKYYSLCRGIIIYTVYDYIGEVIIFQTHFMKKYLNDVYDNSGIALS